MTTESTEQPTELALAGLDADNLLAFLALLGLLRSLEAARPDWRARVAWSGEPRSACLFLDAAADQEAVAAAAEDGVQRLCSGYRFDRKDLKFEPEEFRRAAGDAARDPPRATVFAALAAEVAGRRGNRAAEIEPTPFCFIFGQGHQHFLERLAAHTKSTASEGPAQIKAALFAPWRYERGEEDGGFRWDPIEDRRYALQFGDPSDPRNKIGSVPGANRLAAIGFPVLVSVPTAAGLATLGVVPGGEPPEFVWPLPHRPTSLAGLTALLAHPVLTGDDARSLRPLGLGGIARARRLSAGKYLNVGRARVTWL